MPPLTIRNLLIACMLMLASLQIVRSDFFVNHQLFDWRLYADGKADMPYQGRIGMIPLLRWAEQHPIASRAAQHYEGMILAGSPLIEGYSPEKFVSLVAGILSLWVSVIAVSHYGAARIPRLWWLPGALLLVIAACTLVVRFEDNLWYPYDLPHMALFTVCLVLALRRRWFWAAAVFVLDAIMRETSVFLLPILFLLFSHDSHAGRAAFPSPRTLLRSPRTRLAAGYTAPLFAFWLVLRLVIAHRFRNNPSATGIEVVKNLHDLRPQHWSQLLSVGAYLPIFLWLGRHRLPPVERLMLFGILLAVPAVLYFGVWNEGRVWLEMTAPFAIAAAVEFSQYVHLDPVPIGAGETAEPDRI